MKQKLALSKVQAEIIDDEGIISDNEEIASNHSNSEDEEVIT